MEHNIGNILFRLVICCQLCVFSKTPSASSDSTITVPYALGQAQHGVYNIPHSIAICTCNTETEQKVQKKLQWGAWNNRKDIVPELQDVMRFEQCTNKNLHIFYGNIVFIIKTFVNYN